jgi:hypothetical protein
MFDEWRAEALTEDTAGTERVRVPGKPAAFAGADGVRYTGSFGDPRDPADDVAVLELRGLYAHADVEVTGDRIGGEGPVDHGAYFRPLRIPFEPFEDNQVTVTCHAPRDRFGGLHDTGMVPEEEAVPGIWWGASLESRPLPYIENIDVRPEVTADGATLHLRTTVVADGPIEDRVTYSVRPAGDTNSRGTMQRGSVETDGPGKTVLEHTVEIRDPELWWPRELGRQSRYTIRGKLGDDAHTVTTGVCEIGFEDGQLRVNGEPLPIRGVNLLTADEEDVDRALACNANLVRAHAQVLPEAVYERCDEEGVLVWQDLPLTGPGGFDAERGRELAVSLGRRHGRHPSLAAYAVHDDPVDAFSDGLGSGFLDRLRFRYRAWKSRYDDGPARDIADAIPHDRPTFPVVGGPGVGARAGSYYPGWAYGEPEDIDTLLDRYPAAVVAEFGAGALGTGPGSDPAEVSGFDPAVHANHARGEPEESQRRQATVLETVAESLRLDARNPVAFALRDTDAAGFGVYEHDGTEKAGAEGLSRAFAPLQAFLGTPEGLESELVVVNDTASELTADLSWQAGDDEGATELTVDGRDRWTGGPIDLPAEAEVRLELSAADYTVENRYVR